MLECGSTPVNEGELDRRSRTWDKQEQMWTQVHWADGRHEYREEGYGPEWYVVEELRGGHFSTWDPSVACGILRAGSNGGLHR